MPDRENIFGKPISPSPHIMLPVKKAREILSSVRSDLRMLRENIIGTAILNAIVAK